MRCFAGVFAVLLSVLFAIAIVASGPLRGVASGTVRDVPSDLLVRYVDAAATCDGLPWQVLAAIGFVESRHAQGRADPITGDVAPPILGPALDGRNGTAAIRDPLSADGWMHAQGPMQFLPPTWRRWARLAPGRPVGSTPSPDNGWDAIYTAAAYLCAGHPNIVNIDEAILSYNPSAEYLRAVTDKAIDYGLPPSVVAQAPTP